jgi:hypothetical protein
MRPASWRPSTAAWCATAKTPHRSPRRHQRPRFAEVHHHRQRAEGNLDPACRQRRADAPEGDDKWTLNFDVYAKPLHDKEIHTITVTDVYNVLEPLWLTIPVAAGEFRGRLERVFKRWIATERAKGNTDVIINPATRDLLVPLLPRQP